MSALACNILTFIKMMRNSEYFEQIDRYIDSDLTESELREFETQQELDSDLADELQLHQEVAQAIVEQDVISLRNNLNIIVRNHSENKDFSTIDSFNFSLSEEFSAFRNLDNQFDVNELQKIEHSFPKIHLYQHHIAGKENVHQFYKEQVDLDSISNDESFTVYEEKLFIEIQNSLDEKDILDIRANLKQISQSIPSHRYSSEEIDNFVNNQMDTELRAQFEEELAINSSLAQEVYLIREIDLALEEKGVMDLRASLNEIQRSALQSSSRIEDIEGYIYNELSEGEVISFEAELTVNKELSSEIELIRNIDLALKENDVMGLRNKLQDIALEIASQKQTERSFVTKVKSRRVVLSSVAASLILLLGITGILSRQSSELELYQKFYSTYQTTGISRSADVAADQTLSMALQRFNDREYDAALLLLEDVISRDQNNMVGRFYTGVSLQELGKYQKAISEYETVITDKDNLFVEQANWYIGLCYLQTNEDKKAYKQFKKIAKEDGFYQLKAEAILRKMKYSEN